LVNYESYEKKSEEIANQMGAKPHRSTLFYYHKKYSTELFEYLEHLQFKRIRVLENELIFEVIYPLFLLFEYFIIMS